MAWYIVLVPTQKSVYEMDFIPKPRPIAITIQAIYIILGLAVSNNPIRYIHILLKGRNGGNYSEIRYQVYMVIIPTTLSWRWGLVVGGWRSGNP